MRTLLLPSPFFRNPSPQADCFTLSLLTFVLLNFFDNFNTKSMLEVYKTGGVLKNIFTYRTLLGAAALFFTAQALAINHTPKTIAGVQKIVKQAAADHKHVTVKGAGKGVSGKATKFRSEVIDLKKLNNVVRLNRAKKQITVQAGITWRKIQECINPFGLAVTAMQSFNDFSVGGSIGVNAHGQDFRYAPVGQSIISLVIIDAHGDRITLSREENPELFSCVIGGHGLFGIIVEATLQLTDNTVLEKEVEVVESSVGIQKCIDYILPDTDVALFSARFDMDPDNFFGRMIIIGQRETHRITRSPIIHAPFKEFAIKALINCVRTINLIQKIRMPFEATFVEKPGKLSRNNAMSYSLEYLSEINDSYVNTLQEYFIPLEHAHSFVKKMKKILEDNQVNLINCTLRFVKKDSSSFLPYAQQDCAAFVLFLPLENSAQAFNATGAWTRTLIDTALEHKGTFYLPYQCFATREQVCTAYPQFDALMELKKKYDPQDLFMNDLCKTYRAKAI